MGGFLSIMFGSVALASCNSTVDIVERGECVRLLEAMPFETRTVLNDGGTSGISSIWLRGDSLSAFNLTSPSSFDEFVIAQSTSKSSSFKGYVRCDKSDKIVLFYPASNMHTMINHNGKGGVQLTLYNQDGTLDCISQKYDFCYGKATVNSTVDMYATAALGSFKNLMAIYRMTFQRNDGTSIGDVVALTLSSDDLCPTKNFDIETETFTNAISATELPLRFLYSKSVVYLALFPAEDIEYNVTLETSDGSYYSAIIPTHTTKSSGYYNMTITTNE
ncbi:MAG: hypothetical protein IKR18_11310 [Bacteroidaceae bacterium]|nr:hypothetical protein [Bacteroidaceae bacterium]